VAENSNIARPYAQALFELAESAGDFGLWSEALRVMAMVAVDPNMNAVFINPRISRREIGKAVIEVCGEHIDSQGRNLIRLLAQNRRLDALPAIAEQYETLRAEAERSVRAELESALPISEQERQRISEALKKRLGRDVELVCKINEKLIGGAVIRAGDLVIDGSARARLEKLAAAISA
jgi:F-type H+-transporting ATPase subunit delta